MSQLFQEMFGFKGLHDSPEKVGTLSEEGAKRMLATGIFSEESIRFHWVNAILLGLAKTLATGKTERGGACIWTMFWNGLSEKQRAVLKEQETYEKVMAILLMQTWPFIGVLNSYERESMERRERSGEIEWLWISSWLKESKASLKGLKSRLGYDVLHGQPKEWHELAISQTRMARERLMRNMPKDRGSDNEQTFLHLLERMEFDPKGLEYFGAAHSMERHDLKKRDCPWNSEVFTYWLKEKHPDFFIKKLKERIDMWVLCAGVEDADLTGQSMRAMTSTCVPDDWAELKKHFEINGRPEKANATKWNAIEQRLLQTSVGMLGYDDSSRKRRCL
jgi:hypothetical protein